MSEKDKAKLDYMKPVEEVTWTKDHHMSGYTECGEFHIKGQRINKYDGMPILNANPGHTIDAMLTVLDSSLSGGTGAKTDTCVTQILSISNRTGGDGHVYVRTGQGVDKEQLAWGTWEKLMGMFEKNDVYTLDDLDGYTTNGMYSGLYAADAATHGGVQFYPGDTFLIVTVNGYAVGLLGNNQLNPQITQLLYKLPAKTLESEQNSEIYLRTGSYNKTDKVWIWGNFTRMATDADLSSQVATLTAKINQNAANIASAISDASNALKAAQTEQTAATTASENAGQAIGLANEVKEFAEGIAGKADDAIKKATEAAGKADAAEKAATEAKKATEQHENDKKIHVPTNGEAHQLLMSNGDGTSKWVTLDLEPLLSYGIEFDTTIANPNCIRIGNPEFHRTLPIHSKIRGCLLNDNGVVIKYLNPDTWEGEILDGSSGQVMVEIPEFYIKFEEDGTKRRVKMSLVPISGYKKINKMYVSAYEATVQRSTNKLASVCSTDVDYRGGDNDASRDGTYKTMLGMPATSMSLNDFRTKARNRGSVEWNCNLYRLHKMLWWLFAVEYANFDSQATFNAALDENGYHQGGLGVGVTTWDGTWGTFNGYYPIVPCGVTNLLGNHTGTVDYNVIGSDGSTLKTFAVPRYRGIENPFGHIWKWTDGCKCIIQSEASGGLSKFYVCDDPAKFTASGVGNYDYRGDLSRKDGYVKALILGEDGEIMPLAVGGGSTMYFCDYFYTNIPSSGEAERGVLFGGNATNGASGGLTFVHSADAPSSSIAHFGSRLCFIPNE